MLLVEGLLGLIAFLMGGRAVQLYERRGLAAAPG